MRRASLTTLGIVLAAVIPGCGSSDEKVPPATSYLTKAAPGYRYVPLSAADEASVRKQFGIGAQVADAIIVRRVLKGNQVAAAALVVRLKKGQDPNALADGFEQRATGNPSDVKIGGKDAKLVHSSNLYAVYDTAPRTFLAVFAKTAADAERIAGPVVR